MKFRELSPNVFCLALLLAGCGGGGGGGGETSGAEADRTTEELTIARLSPPGSPRRAFETEEYQRNWGLASIEASVAYAQGATGNGVTVAVIDSGVDPRTTELAGALSPNSTDVLNRATAVDGPNLHGTAISAIIAGRKNDEGPHGVAYESTILSIRAEDPDSCNPVCTYTWENLTEATLIATREGAPIINYSLSGGTPPQEMMDALVEAIRADQLIVAVAGNGNGVGVPWPAKLGATSDGNGQVLTVGSVNAAHELSGSNSAGPDRNYYLVAPGIDVTASGPDGAMFSASGTSFAVPHVSGAAALLLSSAPHLTARELAEILLTTATDLGAPGVDEVYGHGLLNLRRALAPVGSRNIPTGDTIAQGGAPLEASGLVLGAAFGQALRAESLDNAIFVDNYGRTYRAALSNAVGFVQEELNPASLVLPPQTRSLSLSDQASFSFVEARPENAGLPDDRAIATDRPFALSMRMPGGGVAHVARRYGLSALMGAEGAAGSLLKSSTFASPFLDFAGQGSAAALTDSVWGTQVTFGFSQDDQAQSLAGRIGRRIGVFKMDLLFGRLSEDQSVLGSRGEGAFAFGDTGETRHMALNLSLPIDERLELFGSWSQGWTEMNGGRGLISEITGLRSQAFGLGLSVTEVFDEADRVTFGISRPLKVVSGSALLDVPVGRDIDGNVIRMREEVDLSPNGNEIELELRYDLEVAEDSSLDLRGVLRLQPGHDPNAGPEGFLGLRYRARL